MLVLGWTVFGGVRADATPEGTYGQQVIAAVLLAEARGEGLRGMYAVAEVIRTRADHFGVSPLAVVKMRKQFSCLNGIKPPELIRSLNRDRGWEDALAIAKVLYNEPNRLPGIVSGATHFHSGRAYWADGEEPVAVVGTLKFYRLRLPRSTMG